MNGYLVVGRCTSDDIPMRLCSSREDDLEFARTLNRGDVIAEAKDIFRLTVEHVCNISVVEFRDGGPMEFELVRDTDDLAEEEELE